MMCPGAPASYWDDVNHCLSPNIHELQLMPSQLSPNELNRILHKESRMAIIIYAHTTAHTHSTHTRTHALTHTYLDMHTHRMARGQPRKRMSVGCTGGGKPLPPETLNKRPD
jgi:hypothetical protein